MLLAKRIEYKIHQKTRGPSTLRAKLLREGRSAWADIGNSVFVEGFVSLGLTDPAVVAGAGDVAPLDWYMQLDILDAERVALLKGKFDLVRMQHVLEHFTPQEAPRVVQNAASLLKENGILLCTVPDLDVHMRAYRQNYAWGQSYRDLARARINRDPSPADTFSMFCHLFGYAVPDVPGLAHKWCYDATSLRALLETSGCFEKVTRLTLSNPLSEFPFTHNRPLEDLCFLSVVNPPSDGARLRP